MTHTLKKENITLMTGTFNTCWKWLLQKYGSRPLWEIEDMGYRIEKNINDEGCGIKKYVGWVNE